MRIFRVQVGEEGIAMQIATKFKNTSPSRQHIMDFVADKGNLIYAADIGGSLVGYLLAYRLERLDGDNPMVIIYEIEVLENFRKQDIARSLVNELRSECESRMYMKMFVFTDDANIPANRLYESAEGIRKEPATVMYEWKLND